MGLLEIPKFFQIAKISPQENDHFEDTQSSRAPFQVKEAAMGMGEVLTKSSIKQIKPQCLCIKENQDLCLVHSSTLCPDIRLVCGLKDSEWSVNPIMPTPTRVTQPRGGGGHSGF